MNHLYKRHIISTFRRWSTSVGRATSVLSTLAASAVCTGCPGVDATEPGCGNAVVDATLGESCDDGNIHAGDGCSDTCQIEEGFSCETEGEACFSTCGDGIVASDEACDEGPQGVPSSLTCSSFCELPGVCGDGKLDWNEQCDWGPNNGLTDNCDMFCRGLSTW